MKTVLLNGRPIGALSAVNEFCRAAKPTPLELLRLTGPHAGLATLSAELWEAWLSLPRPERTALACRDTHPGMGEEPLAVAVALALGGSYIEALKAACEALANTRGILDHINGKVMR